MARKADAHIQRANTMEGIVSYLIGKYVPLGLIVYGSFASGTNNLNSDFDALLIYEGSEESHDHSVVDGTELDVFYIPEPCL